MTTMQKSKVVFLSCRRFSRIFEQSPLLGSSVQHAVHLVRRASDNPNDRGGKGLPKRALKDASLPRLATDQSDSVSQKQQQIRSRLFFRFFDYLKNYDVLLAKVLPDKAIQMSKLFVNGSKLLFRDMKEFISIYQILSDTQDWKKACRSLSKNQLELYLTLPNQMIRVAPVLIIAALPMMHNVVFPLALMYPKKLLSSHFWTPQVKREVMDEDQVRRHQYYRSLFRRMQKSLVKVKGHQSYYKCQDVLAQLIRDHKAPSVEEILRLQPLFRGKGIFSLGQLSTRELRLLMRVHGLRDWTSWRFKLQQYGNLLREIDKAIDREGIDQMSDDELMFACFTRGLNVDNLTQDELKDYLKTWVHISVAIDSASVALILHLPVLLGYNHKSRIWDNDSVTDV